MAKKLKITVPEPEAWKITITAIVVHDGGNGDPLNWDFNALLDELKDNPACNVESVKLEEPKED
jgi:hypothetical protein